MEIRKYRPTDSQGLYELFYATVHQINQQDYSPEQLAVWAQPRTDLTQWDASLRAHYTLVAEIDHQLVGFGDMTDSGYLDRLYVHHHYQRQGIAQALIAELERYADNQGVARITVAASLTAKPFFLENGYQVVKAQEVQRAGVNLINFLMEKQRLFPNDKEIVKNAD